MKMVISTKMNKVSAAWFYLMFVSAFFAFDRGVMAAADNPYPTVVISDYVFGCMGSNGQSREALERCSCSIDVIASIVSHKDYVRAETVLSMRLISGEKSTIFKTGARWRRAVDLLRRAQAEAEVRCF